MKVLSVFSFTLFIYLFPFQLHAQVDKDIVWQKSFGGFADEYSYDLVQTFDGGFLIAGYTESNNNGDVVGYKGDGDIWIVKTKSDGSIDWKKNYGGSDYDVVSKVLQTFDSGYVFIGTTYSTDGDVTVSKGDADIWLVRLNKNGSVMWEKSFGGTSSDFGYDVKQTSDSGFTIVGSVSSNDGDVINNKGSYDVWIGKVDKTGVLSWKKSYGGSNIDVASKVIIFNDGYVIGGYTSSNNGDITNNKGDNDYWIIRTNDLGSLLWQKNFGGSDDDKLIDMVVKNNKITAVGYTKSSNGDVTNLYGNEDIWLVSCDTLGVLDWEVNFGGSGFEEGNSIFTTNDGGYLISGFTTSNDNDLSTDNFWGNKWIFKLNSTGGIVWQKTLGGDSTDISYKIVQLQDGGYISCGSTASNNQDVVYNHGSNSGTTDIWLIKLASNTSVENRKLQSSNLSMFPNPTSETLHLNGLVPNCKVEIFDMIGHCVYYSYSNNTKVSIDVKALPNGTYSLVISDVAKQESISRKFVKK